MKRLTLSDGAALAYREEGAGAPVLLLHGLGSCADDWDLVVPRLDGDRRLVIPDLRGHGASSKPASGYGVPRMAADVIELCTKVVREPVHVAGISMGGMVAFQLAVDRPDLVRSLTIINSGPEVIARTAKEKLAFGLRLALLTLFPPTVFASLIVRKLFPKPDQRLLRERLHRTLAANDRTAYREATRALLGWSVTDRLATIRCPVLVLASDRDYSPVAAKHAYAAKMRAARVVEIADSGHASTLDRPERIVDELQRFLDEIEAGDARLEKETRA